MENGKAVGVAEGGNTNVWVFEWARDTPNRLTPETSPGASVIFSPDGRRIVYTGRGTDGIFRLFTRMLDQEQVAPLPGTEGAYGPFFSPDGQAVGFFASGKLKKTSVERGGVVVLCDASVGVGGSWAKTMCLPSELHTGNSS